MITAAGDVQRHALFPSSGFERGSSETQFVCVCAVQEHVPHCTAKTFTFDFDTDAQSNKYGVFVSVVSLRLTNFHF